MKSTWTKASFPELPEQVFLKPSSVTDSLHSPGPLAGRTLLRFAHAFESGGGTERYLDDLDRTLLERSDMTIVRLHMARNGAPLSPIREQIGRGTLVRVPLTVREKVKHPRSTSRTTLNGKLKRIVRDKLLYHPFIWRTLGARWTRQHHLRPEAGQTIGAGSAAEEVFKIQKVDLVMLHFFGGSDAEEVIDVTRKAGIPLALLNHFSNDRFLHLSIRKHTMSANGVAGVNGLDVPEYLRPSFSNLSDGIDTNFYRRIQPGPRSELSHLPIILLPARIVREKGQLDLIRAAARLRDEGIECCVALAGRIDASAFMEELRLEVERLRMTRNVRYLGDMGVEQLRDWYAASAVVAFPTYHHEGLGRVLIEAQAMGVPVVAYATGGVPEAMTDNKTGYLLRTGDVLGLGRRLRELLLCPALRSSMGSAGRAMVEDSFSLTALAERHERFYGKLFRLSNIRASVHGRCASAPHLR